MTNSSIRCRAGLLLLVRHVAKRFDVEERTVRWWAKTNRLPGQKLGVRIWGFTEADVIAFELKRGPKDEAA